jgi:hypothetical protein
MFSSHKEDIFEIPWESLADQGELTDDQNQPNVFHTTINDIISNVHSRIQKLGIPLKRNYFDIPKLTYEKNGQTTEIQGMMHTAPSVFYKKIQEQLESHDGVILYEGIKNNTPSSSPGELLQEVDPLSDLSHDSFSEALGLSTQHELKIPKENSINSDFSEEEVAARIKSQKDPRKIEKEKLLIPFVQDIRKKCKNFLRMGFSKLKEELKVPEVLKSLFIPESIQELHEKFSILPNYKIIIEERNKELIRHIEDQHQQGHNTLVTYGAGHLEHLDKLLREDQGWQLRKVDFLRFWGGKTFSILGLIGNIIKMPWIVFKHRKNLKESIQLEEQMAKEKLQQSFQKVKDTQDSLKKRQDTSSLKEETELLKTDKSTILAA